MLLGFTPLAVVAIRSSIAVILLLAYLLVFKRAFFYIYPLGLAGCAIAGFVNGVGSIFYYTALSRLDTSIGQLLYSFYPLFVALWLVLDRQSVSRITILRLLLILPGVYLLVSNAQHKIDLVGAAMSKDLITVSPETLMEEALEIFRTHRISGAPVLNNGELAGIVSIEDLIHCLQKNDLKAPVGHYMPLGNLAETYSQLLILNPQINWLLLYRFNDRVFELDDREIKSGLDGIPFTEPEIIAALRKMISDGIRTVQTGDPE